MIQHNKKKLAQEKRRLYFIDLYIVLYIFIAMSGSLSQIYLYVVMGFLVGLVVLLLFRTRFFDMEIEKNYFLILFYLLYIFVVGLPVAGILYTSKQVGASIIQFSPLVIYHYYKTRTKVKTKLFILKCIYLILLFYLILSYFAYTRLGVEARRIADNSIDYGNLAIGGGYSFAYAITIFAVYLFDRLKNSKIKNANEKILYIVLIILSTIVIFETRSTITFLAYSVGLLLTLMFPASNSKNNYQLHFITKIILFSIFIISIFILKGGIGNLFVSLGRNINNTIGDRVQSLGYLLLNSGDGSYAASRMTIPINSFKTFLEYPIFGIAHLHGNGFYKPTLFGAGNHCEWVDALTNWGLMGGLPFLFIYFSTILRIYKSNERKLGIGLWVTFIVLGLFNPFRSIQTSLILFLVLPLHTDLHNQRKMSQYNE